MKLTFSMLALAAGTAIACGDATDDSPGSGSGTGSAAGTGGASDTTGGAAPTGGASDITGGAIGTGGAVGTGGVFGTGGAVGTGGAFGTGGDAGTGGLGLTGGASNTGGSATGGATAGGSKVVMAYMYNMDLGGLTYDDADLQYVDYVVHAFADVAYPGNGAVSATGDGFLDDHAGIIERAHQHVPPRKVILSIGGAGHWGIIETVKQEDWDQVVPAIVSYLQANDYDGVDIDLEFPGQHTSPEAFTAFMTDLYAAVKAWDSSKVVMFGISPGYWVPGYEWDKLGAVSDYAFYFCYDWSDVENRTGPIESSVQPYLDRLDEASCKGALNYVLTNGTGTSLAGYPASKIVMGLPFYTKSQWGYEQHWFDAPEQVRSGTLDALSREVSYDGYSWTPPSSIDAKLEAVLDPAETVLYGGSVLGGAGYWSWGQDTSDMELTKAVWNKVAEYR